MKNRASCIAFVLVAFLFAKATADHHETATRADFEQLRDALVGRWTCDIKWITDWPGVGKKGDRVRAYTEIRPIDDGNAAQGKFYGGKGSGTWLIGYNAAAKRIVDLNVGSGGSMWTSVYSKKDEKTWACTTTGSTPDGAKIEGNLSLKISDDGDTHTWTGTMTIEGKEVDELHDVWSRLNK